jgi:chromosome segregation ATPase
MKATKPMNTASDFSKHIKGLQHHADENIEDEYIKNLQQQIGYMELELKLLKEKEIEAKQSVSQIDKFFNDGVPLNENILALKNQYNHAKKEAENKMDEFQDKKMAELKLANDQKSQYEKLTARLKDLTNEMEVKEETFTKELHALRTQFWDEKHTREDLEKELKELEMLFRAKTDENLQMTRT